MLFRSYERSAAGLVEYGFFINELWATKSAAREQEWLSLEPLLVRHKFDSVMRRAGKGVIRVSRPEDFDVPVEITGAGGNFTFLAYQPGPWRRIVTIEVAVDGQGAVAWNPAKVLATLAGAG